MLGLRIPSAWLLLIIQTSIINLSVIILSAESSFVAVGLKNYCPDFVPPAPIFAMLLLVAALLKC
jgi:hypothetical protein